MRHILALLLLSVLCLPVHAETPAVDTVTQNLLGQLPRPGNLMDVLECAGTNEVLWLTAMKADPRDIEGDKARQKASWYSAVALWIFAVESQAIFDAVVAAEKQPKQKVFERARQCRDAPSSWRN